MENKNEILMKHNALIKARYDINTYENKLFILLLYKLQKINETTCKCLITTSQIKNMLNARTVRNKKEISTLLVELRKRSIYFKIGDKWGEYGFINGHEYDKRTDTFEITASEKVYSLLRDYMKVGYTPINLQIWLSLKSSYSQRFYDLLRLWSNTKTIINYTIEELREILMLENKYEEYRDFKRRVVTPSVKELNETGYFEIDIKENKVGRKVVSIDFIVKDLDKRKYFRNEDKNIIDIENIEDVDVKENTESDESVNKMFFVPSQKLFTKKTLEQFKLDFSSYDFKDNKIKNLFYEAVCTTLDKDNVDKIYVKSYKYFKKVLENKLDSMINENKELITESKGSIYKKNAFHNFNENFTKYTEEQFNLIVEKSQREKYGR